MQRFDIEFTQDGAVFDDAQVQALVEGLSTSDLLVLSHGWNNDLAEARGLYDELVGNLQRLLDIRDLPDAPEALRSLSGRELTVCQVFWPSKRFAEADLIPGGGAASATTEDHEALLRTLDALAEDPERLGEQDRPEARVEQVERAKALVPRLETDPGARAEFVEALRSLTGSDDAVDDDGYEAFATADPEDLFAGMSDPVTAPAGPGRQGATAVGADGGAAGLGDLLSGIGAAARRLANLTTYYRMKARAGTVGVQGLAPVLARCRATPHEDLRVHLVGHSFGGRLVTAAANALPDDARASTLTLLQAAFSHNGLSGRFGEGQEGAFRAVLARQRVTGPVVVTHTKNDRAVGVAYPLASRIAGQNAASLGDADDPYGGMGRNGAQHTTEVDGRAAVLEQVGHAYGFAPAKVYNLLADTYVHDHGDVRGVQVAYALLSAVAAS
ncbi:alpha/beta fold hydrolase [Phycicoccus flavus]|uniref:Serine-threonine protein kinase n=1 Tax=Phycicoccus flavus TaxID=2502783 RepID=A0A8T6RCC4_9MICO|nr:hypothetical protein [Phycicoccus flavus]NHA69821.1 hypothetical protein [Phycicoccus flavus]